MGLVWTIKNPHISYAQTILTLIRSTSPEEVNFNIENTQMTKHKICGSFVKY